MPLDIMSNEKILSSNKHTSTTIDFTSSTKASLTLSLLRRSRQVISSKVLSFIILHLLQDLQLLSLNQTSNSILPHQNKLRSKTWLFKPTSNRTQSNGELLHHLIHMVVVRITAIRRRKQIFRRQSTLDIRRTKRSQVSSSFISESIHLLADNQFGGAGDGCVGGGVGEAVSTGVDNVGIRVGDIHGILFEILVGAEVTETVVGLGLC